MHWADALGIGLGLLSVVVNAVVVHLILGMVARWARKIGSILGYGPNDDWDEDG